MANKHVFAIYDTNMFGFFCVSLFAAGLGCIGKPKGEKAKWSETNKPNKFFWVVLGNQKEIRKKEKEKHWGVPSIWKKQNRKTSDGYDVTKQVYTKHTSWDSKTGKIDHRRAGIWSRQPV